MKTVRFLQNLGSKANLQHFGISPPQAELLAGKTITPEGEAVEIDDACADALAKHMPGAIRIL